MNYHPEKYWSTVGKRIKEREGGLNVIAGDDEPFYHYKRQKFLHLLNSIDFKNKSVVEIGCGPGGNLVEVLKKEPQKLTGVDISQDMLNLAKEKIPQNVELVKTEGTTLPFPDRSFDIAFTATVLQHNTDRKMLDALIKEICRISNLKVILFERIEHKIKGDELCEGRPIDFYKSRMEENGFRLVDTKFINIGASYYVSGAIRKIFNASKREEGESISKVSEVLQTISLPTTKFLDNFYRPSRDLAKLEFERV